MTFGWKTTNAIILSIRSKALPALRHSNLNALMLKKDRVIFGSIKSLHKPPKCHVIGQ